MPVRRQKLLFTSLTLLLLCFSSPFYTLVQLPSHLAFSALSLFFHFSHLPFLLFSFTTCQVSSRTNSEVFLLLSTFFPTWHYPELVIHSRTLPFCLLLPFLLEPVVFSIFCNVCFAPFASNSCLPVLPVNSFETSRKFQILSNFQLLPFFHHFYKHFPFS